MDNILSSYLDWYSNTEGGTRLFKFCRCTLVRKSEARCIFYYYLEDVPSYHSIIFHLYLLSK